MKESTSGASRSPTTHFSRCAAGAPGAAMGAGVANFAPELRGYVAGACTAFFGLSIATLVTLYCLLKTLLLCFHTRR